MKWIVFIVTHGPIIEKYYSSDPGFSNEKFVFINVSEIELSHDAFKVLNRSDFAEYIHLGKWYAEAEAIYNVYKNRMYESYDYIGFIHWDYDLLSWSKFIGNNVSSTIARLISRKEEFISFSTFNFEDDYNQKIMMDQNFPDQLTGDGTNCWDEIIIDYNRYFQDSIDLTFLMTKCINLCSAFLCRRECFEEMMGFCSSIIESKKLDDFDSKHLYRFQGGMMERYIGCYSHKFNIANLPLYHRWSGAEESKKRNSFTILIVSKILNKIKNVRKI